MMSLCSQASTHSLEYRLPLGERIDCREETPLANMLFIRDVMKFASLITLMDAIKSVNDYSLWSFGSLFYPPVFSFVLVSRHHPLCSAISSAITAFLCLKDPALFLKSIFYTISTESRRWRKQKKRRRRRRRGEAFAHFAVDLILHTFLHSLPLLFL